MQPTTASRPACMLAVAGLVLAACGWPSAPAPTGPPATSGPASQHGAAQGLRPASATAVATSPAAAGSPHLLPPAHTVVVVMENHAYGQVIGSRKSPFLNSLARQGALFTASYAIAHPSEPNYLALFSGSTQGATSDSCPHRYTAPNLGSELIGAGLSFAGYSEGLPAPGSSVCSAAGYARRHGPWTNFTNVPASASRPFSAFPARHFAQLPTVSFVIPNLCHDMHNCPVATGDSWLRAHIATFASWAMTHDSLLIVTFDEDNGHSGNHIATIFAGQMVRPGSYRFRINHYSVLRTIEQIYRLRPDALAAAANVIRGVWR